jgi:transposase-like protein
MKLSGEQNMANTYTPSQKNEAFAFMVAGANMKLISKHLKIPVRTLYAWRRESRIQEELQQIITKNTLAAEQQLQQLQQKAELPPIEQSAFGMTREELVKALEVEYIPSPYEDLRQALMKDINQVQPSISEDPDSAHVRALAVSRMIDDVIRLEPFTRREKPDLNIIKYEYQDGTYHDIPQWSNRIYERAQQAFDAVIRQARREYYAIKGEDYEESNYFEHPSLEELAQMHFTAEDFIPQHTGILAWWVEHQKKYPRYTNNQSY